jgi:5-(carboxyamino)imidazole ribonucleotide synthase
MSSIQNVKIGILGGGQLGRMLIQAGLDLNLDFRVLDPDANSPCKSIAAFYVGNLNDYETVIEFGKKCDLITIEIESVNTEALKFLEKKGKQVFPQPHLIELIQDKRTQKQFFKDHNIPTADFVLVENQDDIRKNINILPAVNKLAREGYDGKGVFIIKTEDDISKAFNARGLLEKLIDFEKEISVIVARNERGETKSYPPVEMVFHPEANLVEYLFSPAQIATKIVEQANSIALQLVERMELVGILAVEMFVTKDGQVLVNEVAPRPHNSGHQTIEANITSQYEQHLRAILNLPLGSTKTIQPSAMVNVLGQPGFSGVAIYEGLEDTLKVDGAFVHLYGKKETKPFRKMGHVTVMDECVDSLKDKAKFIKENLKIVA